MIDLHLHLDGSLPPELLIKMAEIEGVSLPAEEEEELIPYLTAPEDCGSLNEYLEKFDLPVSCMQSRETLILAAEGLVFELAREGLLYAEIRFAPQQHTRKGLTQRQVVEAVAEGIRKGCEKTEFKAGLILCCMRGGENQKENEETIRLAKEFLGNGVCAVDLAGAEALFPTSGFQELFALGKELSVPCTIHAGEAAGPESIRAALSFGAKRIGHGVGCVADEALMEQMIREKITLEVCVISNLQTRAVPSEEDHPILKLLRRGMRVTVNTDNMTVSGTTLEKEFALLKKMGMTAQEQRQMLHYSAEAAFLPLEEREALKKAVDRCL